MGFSLFLTTLACLGFFNFHFEPSRPLLYTPYNSDLHAQDTALLPLGWSTERTTSVLMTHPTDSSVDLLTTTYLSAVLDVRAAVLATTAGSNATFSNLCVRGTALGAAASLAAGLSLNSRASQCLLQSAGDFWGNDLANITADASLNTTLATTVYDATGRPVWLADVVSINSATSGVAAYQLTFSLMETPDGLDDFDDEVPRDYTAELWERALRTTLESFTYSTSTLALGGSSFSGLKLRVLTPERSLREVRDALITDRAPLALVYFAVWFLCVMIYFRRNYVRSRMGVSVAAVVTVLLALVSGYGAAAGVGLDFHVHMLLVSFLLLALGLGDAGILMACIQPFAAPSGSGASSAASATPFDLNALASTRQTRFWWIRAGEHEGVAAPLGLGGNSISSEAAISVGTAAGGPFLTSATVGIISALLLGAFTSLPSFRSFCLTAALAVIFLWVFLFCFFVPCLALDARRQNDLRCDVPCCCLPRIEHNAEDKLCTSGHEPFEENDSSVLGAYVGAPLVHLMFMPVMGLVLMLASFAILGVGIYGCVVASADLSVGESLFLPRHSGLASDLAARDVLFPQRKLVAAYGANSESGAVDIDFFAHMAALDTLSTSIGYNTDIVQSTVRFWWTDYLAYLADTSPYNVGIGTNGLVSTAGRPVSSTVLETSLSAFLATDTGAAYWHDLMPSPTTPTTTLPLGGGLTAMRVQFRLVHVANTGEEVTAMRGLRDTVPYFAGSDSTSTSASAGLPQFPFDHSFYLLESQREILWMVARHMVIAGCAIFLMLLFLMASLWGAILVLIGVAIVCVEVFGILCLADEPFSAESVHGLLLTPVLAAWIFTHVVHAFLRCVGTRPYRARKVLGLVGGVLVDYSAYTFLCVLFLAGATTPSYFAAFTTIGLTAVLSFFHALAVWPLLLGRFGPDAAWMSEILLSHDPDKSHAKKTDDPIGTQSRTRGSTSVSLRERERNADPANPFGDDSIEYQAPASSTVVEMQALVAAARQRETRAPAPSPVLGPTPAYAQPEQMGLRTAYNPHAPTAPRLGGDSQLTNRTPQKPTHTVGWI